MDYPIKGSCQCGQVHYTMTSAPKKVFACHCRECQKLSTAPFSVTAFMDASAITFHGEMGEWSRLADSGNKNNAKFCLGCGNRIYHYNPDDSSSIKLKLKPTGMEDDTIFKPSVHLWVSEKLSWVVIPDDVEVLEKQS